jgi:hypothetical protein
MEFEIYGNPVTSIRPAPTNSMTALGLSLIKTNDGVSIRSSALDGTHLSTDVFALNGRIVRHLFGSDASFWNCKDSFGHFVTNGTYLLRVTSAGRTLQDKIAIYR